MTSASAVVFFQANTDSCPHVIRMIFGESTIAEITVCAVRLSRWHFCKLFLTGEHSLYYKQSITKTMTNTYLKHLIYNIFVVPNNFYVTLLGNLVGGGGSVTTSALRNPVVDRQRMAILTLFQLPF